MRRSLALALWLAALATGAAAQVVDAIIVVVNGQPILQSEWDGEVRCEALLDSLPLEQVSAEQQKTALQRLIDQELLRQQMRAVRLPAFAAGEVQNRIAEIRRQLPEAATDSGWAGLLQRYGISEAEFADRLRTELEIMRFLDARLRPGIHIDQRAIQAYYAEKFLPELRKAGAAQVPLAEVSAKIQEVLVQQRMDEVLSDWIKALREQSDIRVAGSLGEPRSPGAEAK